MSGIGLVPSVAGDPSTNSISATCSAVLKRRHVRTERVWHHDLLGAKSRIAEIVRNSFATAAGISASWAQPLRSVRPGWGELRDPPQRASITS
jgi:hypothetical protein